MSNTRNVPVTRDGKRAGFMTLVKESPGLYRTADGRYLFVQRGHVWNVERKHNSGLPGHCEVGTGFASLAYAVSSIADHERGKKE